MTELWQMDATEQAGRIREGQIAPSELMEAFVSRIERLNPDLNAIVGLDPEAALARAKAAAEAPSGPFAGVPFVVKDLLPYPGLRSAMGCRLFAAHVPAESVPYSDAIDQAGLLTVAKTTTSELGLLGSTETLLEGVTRNPWDTDLSAGGSSGGAAAAVAAGLVPFAHASDGGGSIRLPAALHGLFGFKPSAGATARAVPVPNDFVRLVSDNCLSRSVRDCATFLAATSASPQDPVRPQTFNPLRIGVYKTDAFGRPASNEVQAAVEFAAQRCVELGHHVEEVSPPPIDGGVISETFFTLAGAAVFGLQEMMKPMLGRALGPQDIEPFTLSLLQWFCSLGADAYPKALKDAEAQGAAMNSFLDGVDVALCPTVGGPRPRLGHLAPHLPKDVLLSRTEELAAFTAIHNLAGATAMSVPMSCNDEGFPVGVQFAASPGQDTRLLQLAYQLEEAAPWHGRWPQRATDT